MGKTEMFTGPKWSEEGLVWQLSIWGRVKRWFELPERSEKYCLECSADVATAALLTTEIDTGTFSGQDVDVLIGELEELSFRLLARSQSAELGSF
jgi:hypothetical protein